MSIPKKIHYCWFGGQKMPMILQNCIQTWKKTMPDYQIICWNEDNFIINDSIPFVKEAYQAKAWAFVADYARLEILYKHGGIYFDTDVIAIKPFDDFLGNDFFSGIEYHKRIIDVDKTWENLNDDGTKKYQADKRISGIGILCAIMGAAAGHMFINDCIDFYNNQRFILPDGGYNKMINMEVLAKLAYEKYGFRYKNALQKCEYGNMIFYPSKVLAGEVEEFRTDSYALHYCELSWTEKNLRNWLWRKLRMCNLARIIYGKKPCKKPKQIIKEVLGKNKKTIA
ncbi:MAG: hypothetical protein LBG95_05890 [Treponema sp.]|nr:hypothetical protein [Treponema sp.]